MTADDLRKISQEFKPVVSDIRLEKYVEWLQRDCMRSAQAGKYNFKVDYSIKPLRDEFILQLQDRFIADGYNVIPNEENFRQFVIDWAPQEVPVKTNETPKDNVLNG